LFAIISVIAFFASPSFHDGSGPSAALETLLMALKVAIPTDPLNKSLRVSSMKFPLAMLSAAGALSLPAKACPISWLQTIGQ
jgi:hypothetical protein